MLPTGNPDQATAFQVVFYTLWMIAISLLPYTNYTGSLSLSAVGALIVLVLGGVMLYFGIQLMLKKSKEAARLLMLSSVVYISLVQIVYVMDKMIGEWISL